MKSSSVLIMHGLYFYVPGIFNYYHLSLLLTSLNCVADPALYCFVSESARRGLYRAVFRPVTKILCCCWRRGNASPGNPATDSHEVATDENNGQPTVMLLTHTNTLNNLKTDLDGKNTILEENMDGHKRDGKPSCVIAMDEQSQKTRETDKNSS